MATQTYPQVERRKPPQKIQTRDYGWTLYLSVITLLLAGGYFVSYDHLYEPGDDIGYNLGLAGGLMMLSLLLYPMRKRFRFMSNWIILPKWFKWHMVFGVMGPTLVMFHSTFRIESINAGVAMACMMISSGSGIFGRFFYTKVHYGLYGRQVTFQQLQKDLQGSEEARSILSFAPAIQRRLADFHARAMRLSERGRIGVWNFLTLGIRTAWFTWSIIRDLKKAMYADAAEKHWNAIQMKRLNQIYAENEKSIRSYINAVREMAEFSTYERLFSLWHIFHVPIVYLLVPSAIWHVIAVHRY
ncbi:MAG: hypothetical protein PHH36_13010 [Sideroxydans sp.]|nr:hypothetical protein [Sideroxydans sp.]